MIRGKNQFESILIRGAQLQLEILQRLRLDTEPI